MTCLRVLERRFWSRLEVLLRALGSYCVLIVAKISAELVLWTENSATVFGRRAKSMIELGWIIISAKSIGYKVLLRVVAKLR